MTFVISASQKYVLHFGHFFENRENSGLTPGQTELKTRWPNDPDVKDDPNGRPIDPVTQCPSSMSSCWNLGLGNRSPKSKITTTPLSITCIAINRPTH